MNKPLLISTRNPDKVREFRELMSPLHISVHSMLDFPEAPETIEDKDSIYGNAIKKAIAGAQYTGMLCLADDTGLFIAALDGAPGVYSARYAGAYCSYLDNRRKVLLQMEGISERSAYFETAVALADSEGLISVVSGKVQGRISDVEKGENGFGYDSIFEVEGENKSYAEMSEQEKNMISHRNLAVQKMLPLLQNILKLW